jgi:arylsulfatase
MKFDHPIRRAAAALALLAAAVLPISAMAAEEGKKPNILVIFGDDVGQTNISAYSMGVMGYKTPNIDRIAKEGLLFTDYYAENSCTAGRSSFITGQTPFRTGLSKVGVPGAPQGIQARDITIAQALKALGYATGQFGKNHLGDRNEFLPTNHGFDEFYGNLYHLNAEEEPERPYWNEMKKADADWLKVYNPRGVIHSFADGKIDDTGPMTRKRMETIEDETTNAAIEFTTKQVKAGKPFFTWMNFTRMHMFTHVRAEYRGKAGLGATGYEYADGMWEMDQNVGKLLKMLDDLGVADDTIVVFTTDNGPNAFSWPDAATTPFRSEKDSNWEGAFRVPAVVRWPRHIQPGSVANGMFSGLDWFPTLLAAAGDADIKDRLLKGSEVGGKTFKVHLDGYNQLPYLTGKEAESARHDFYYFDDDGLLVAVRFDNWKVHFCEQRQPGQFDIWANPFTCLRVPRMFNLRTDPYEHGQISGMGYDQWRTENAYIVFEASKRAGEFLQTFLKYPPSQLPGSFSIDDVQKSINEQVRRLEKQAAGAKGD